MNATQTAPMAKISTQVQETSDYAIFQSIDGNRKINDLHLRRLVDSMRMNYLLSPILVNEKMQVIDGQHRLAAAMELKLPVRYIVVSGYGLNEVQTLNANSKTWKSDDYLASYCNLGYGDYLTYRTFMEKYGFNHNECMAMLSGTTHTGGVVNLFKWGHFKVKSYKDACVIAEQLGQVGELYSGYQRRSFVLAMMGALKDPKFVFEEFLSKLRLQQSLLTDCTSIPQYLHLIEKIYNYKRPFDRRVILRH